MNNFIRLSIIIFSLIFSLTCHSIPVKKTVHWNPGHGYHPFKYATRQGIEINNISDTLEYDYFKLDSKSDLLYLTFRAKNFNGNPTKKYHYYNDRKERKYTSNPFWGFFINTEKGPIVITVEGKEIKTEIETTPAIDITIHDYILNRQEKKSVKRNINPYDGENLWAIRFEKGICRILGSDGTLQDISDYVSGSSCATGFGFIAGWGTDLLVTDINMEYLNEEIYEAGKFTDPEFLKDYLAESQDPMEGYWTVFDRELEESLLKMGGNYVLASVKEGDDYLLYYMEGASVNKENWAPGDLKATLRAAAFNGIFDVEWLDSQKEIMSHEIKAQRGDGNTLTIQFPYQSSKLRLRKIM